VAECPEEACPAAVRVEARVAVRVEARVAVRVAVRAEIAVTKGETQIQTACLIFQLCRISPKKEVTAKEETERVARVVTMAGPPKESNLAAT
jgi:hypothetical protein